ncbi:hypothetical protein KY285_013436 [Solanum tuberosum]|nr:hypothetical protein KY285_013436 [Solanum tuberosum]
MEEEKHCCLSQNYMSIVEYIISFVNGKQVVAENPISQAKAESAILQGHCGSCWAFGAAESLSDHFCIHYGLHARAIYVGMVVNCDGGYPLEAWRYFVRKGVITEECDPYFDNKGCSHPGCEPGYPTQSARGSV